MALPNTLMTDTGTGGTRNTATTTSAALRYGATGDAVKRLQQALLAGGYYTGSIDGSYGPKTLAAVKAYQKKMGLTVDGIAGPQTQGSLYTLPKTTTTPVTTPKTTTKPVQQTGIPAVGVPLPEDIARLQGVPTTDPNAVSAAQFDAQMQAIRAQQTATPVPQTGVPIGGTPLPEDIARMQGVPTTPTTPIPGAPLPEEVERRKAELAGTVPTPTIQEEQQAIKTELDNVITGTTGTGTGGTGTGTSGTNTTGGTTTGTGTKTGTTIEGEPATDTWQNYYKKATETAFEYNPAQDQEYLRAASVLEQQVTDMMVGRGGLYSSVAHAALQSRLMSLQVDYQKMAYDKYLEERNFNMQIAGFLADREDAEWDKSFKMAQFKADLEQQKFDNSIKSAQLRLQQASAYASRVAAQARAKQAEAQTKLAFQEADVRLRKAQLDSVVESVKKNGMDAQSATFLGGNAASILVNLDYSHPIVQQYIKGAYNYLDYEINNLAIASKEAGSIDTYVNALTGFASEAEQTADPTVYYSAEYADASFAINSKVKSDPNYDYGQAYSDAYNNRDYLISLMGTSYYSKLMNDLADKSGE